MKDELISERSNCCGVEVERGNWWSKDEPPHRCLKCGNSCALAAWKTASGLCKTCERTHYELHEGLFVCKCPCHSDPEKSAFDLDGFLAGAEEAGEILDEKEKTDNEIAATISKRFGRAIERLGDEKTAGQFCMNENCDGDLEKVQGGHLHPEKRAAEREKREVCQFCDDVSLSYPGFRKLYSHIPAEQADDLWVKHIKHKYCSKLPPPQSPMEWEEDFSDAWYGGKFGVGASFAPKYEPLKAFITRTVKEAQEDYFEFGRKVERKKIVDMVQNHVTQNTYEGDESLVYQTTLKEIIARLTEQEA